MWLFIRKFLKTNELKFDGPKLKISYFPVKYITYRICVWSSLSFKNKTFVQPEENLMQF